MEYSLSPSITINKLLATGSYDLPSPVKNHVRLNGSLNNRFAFSGFSVEKRRRSTVLVARASKYGGFSSGGGRSYCEFSGLNTPIEPVTPAGRFLSSVLLNERKSFHDAVAETLENLVADLDDAYKRKSLNADTSEACLHRRIAEMKKRECQTAIEDVMYMLILYKFSEIKVYLIPKLSMCIYNNRLEILPSKDYELESVHSSEILELIRSHLTSVIGWRSDFSVTDNWAPTKIKRSNLHKIYTSSILFGYFLKSATLRHQLETALLNPIDDMALNLKNSGNHLPLPELYTFRRNNLEFGHTHNTISPCKKKLSSYLMGFAPDSLTKCGELNSKESLNLIARHNFGLFGKIEESDEVICTSLATLKRFVLEGIAFGSFLWDTEEYVKTVYNLQENK